MWSRLVTSFFVMSISSPAFAADLEDEVPSTYQRPGLPPPSPEIQEAAKKLAEEQRNSPPPTPTHFSKGFNPLPPPPKAAAPEKKHGMGTPFAQSKKSKQKTAAKKSKKPKARKPAAKKKKR